MFFFYHFCQGDANFWVGPTKVSFLQQSTYLIICFAKTKSANNNNNNTCWVFLHGSKINTSIDYVCGINDTTSLSSLDFLIDFIGKMPNNFTNNFWNINLFIIILTTVTVFICRKMLLHPCVGKSI